MTSEHLEEALDVMRKSFFIDEKVCIGVEMSKSKAAQKELEDLCMVAAKDGLSYVAIDKSNFKVVGVTFNKMQVDTKETTYFQQFAAACKEPSSKALVNFMDQVDVECNLFELCKVDCILELMFLAVLPEYRKQQIGNTLTNLTIEAAKTLRSGINCKRSITEEDLTLEPVPKVVSSIFTSLVTQHIGQKFGFTVAKAISYENFVFNGKKFSERIGPENPSTTVEYLFV